MARPTREYSVSDTFFFLLSAFVTTLMQIIKLSLTEPFFLTLATISCNNSWNGCAVCQTDGYPWEHKISLGANRSNCFELTFFFFDSSIRYLFFRAFLLFIFNRRIIALQYCIGFDHTTTWISHRYTYVPYLLNLPTTSPYPASLRCHRAPAWAPCLIQQLAISSLL